MNPPQSQPNPKLDTLAQSHRSSIGTAKGDDAEFFATIRLAMLPKIGPRTIVALLNYFGSAESVLEAPGPELAQVAGVGPKLIHTIRTAHHHVDLESILEWCDENECKIVVKGRPGYPKRLEDLVDAPPMLFVSGDIVADDEIAVAIVGTRHATRYGLTQSERFGHALARAGVTVVSGLARGIDSAAHEGALSGGGRTIAVLGSGLGEIYPSENQGLADAVAADGAVISEYAPQAKPRGGMFPQRNRLISGLSLATLVVEAPDRSGALITARMAGEQNREVLAVPGNVSNRASRGCNQLIRDGATLVQSIDDVLEALGPMRESVTTSSGHEIRNASELKLNEIERTVLEAISSESTMVDEVIQSTELPANQVIATISVLEVRRLVRRLSGQHVARI